MSILNIHEFGDPGGEVLVAIHGITGHGRRFRRLAEEAWPQRSTVAVDLRGHGRSLSNGPWSIAQHVADILDTLDASDIATADLIGHSYGGVIACHLLAAAPERINRLVMLDPAFHRPAELMNERAMAEIDDPGFASVDEAMFAEMDGFDDHVLPAAQENVHEHLVHGRDGRYRFRYHRPAVIAGWGELCSPVPTITESRPTLAVAAERSGFVTPVILADLRASLGDDLHVAHIDSGHTLDWERFEDTVAAMTAFL